MTQLPKPLWDELWEIAIASPDSEICGLILENSRIHPCTNSANADDYKRVFGKDIAEGELPTKSLFKIDEREYAIAEEQGTITGVYHSHVSDDLDFSPQDIQTANLMELPWYLLPIKSGKSQTYVPGKIEPYLNREWHWTWQNCFTLWKDWYQKELGIRINWYFMTAPDAWGSNQSVGYLEHLGEEGFIKLADSEHPKKHDVIVMSVGGKPPNHAAVLIDDRTGTMLHHLSDRPSCTELYDGYWRKHTHSIWRHKSLCH